MSKQISFLSTNSHEVTLSAGTKVDVLTMFKSKQANLMAPIDPQLATSCSQVKMPWMKPN